MKYNEPIRAKGIGRNQLAFPTGGKYSELLNDEDEFNLIAQDSTLHIAQEVTSQAIGLSRSSATAAASSAHKRAQNYPFGMQGVTSFAKSGAGAFSVPIPFSTVNVINPNYFYDSRDQTIYVNEAGWYWVQAFFYSTSIQGSLDWGLQIATNVSSGIYTETYEQFFAYQNANKHPTLAGSTIINLPNQNEVMNRSGRYGFQIRLFTDASFVSFGTANTRASLHVFKLSEIFESDRRFTTQV